MSTSTVAAVRPYTRTRGENESVWFLGRTLLTFLATGEDTDGQFSLLEFKAAPGAEPLAHTHDNEDEFFYLVDGEMTFQVGDLTVEARAGSWVAVPRGTLHSFKARSEQVTLLVMYTPAGFERFFQELSVPAESLTTPPVLSGAPDVQKILSAGARNGCNFVKPF